MPSIHNTSKNEIQYWRIDEYTAIARNYSKNFEKLFNSLIAPEDEGIICRKPNGIYNGPNAETWMQKFRRKNLTKLY
jgi:ATP-dependent DNA ligase